MRILVDMDGVLADFDGGFLEKWRIQHPEKEFIPLERRKKHYMSEEYPEKYRIFVKKIYTAPEFFFTLKPVEGGIEAIKEMEKMGNEVFICSSPLVEYKNCVLEKYRWVEKNLGFEWTEKVILTRDKTIINADILIDDKPEVDGIALPIWEHVIYDQTYNRWAKDKRRLTWENWKEVLF